MVEFIIAVPRHGDATPEDVAREAAETHLGAGAQIVWIEQVPSFDPSSRSYRVKAEPADAAEPETEEPTTEYPREDA